MLFDCVRLTQVLVFIESVIVKKKWAVYVNWWWYQWILEKYQHFNTFDTGIVNELIHDEDTYVRKLCIFIFFEFFEFFKTFVGRFLIGETYQYGCHPPVLSHHAIGTAECDESYCNVRGDHIWTSGGGEFFYHAEQLIIDGEIPDIYTYNIF
jgi:hypothetical protein